MVSYVVSKLTIKNCFDVIDTYVKETTDALHDALKKLIDVSRQSK